MSLSRSVMIPVVFLVLSTGATAMALAVDEEAEAVVGELGVTSSPGRITDTDDPPPCGYTFLHGDETYEDGYSWRSGGVVPPDYGSFAECFETGALEVCALTYDLSTLSGYPEHTFDAYVWDDDGGLPGDVLYLVTDLDPGPIAIWPEISRHTVPLMPSCYPSGSCWIGYWGNWPGGLNGWFVAADVEGSGALGCPFTKIAPGSGYPAGWQNVEVVWGPTRALGIGFLGHSPLPAGTEDEGAEIRTRSWGRIKALYDR